MNILNKVTFEGMKKSKTRTIVTIIGVILSATMITAIATFGVSLLSYLTKGEIEKEGDYHVEFVDVPASFAEERAKDTEVFDTITFDSIGYAKLDNSKNPDKPYLFIAGFNDKTFDNLPIKLLSGKMPENSKEIIVSQRAILNGCADFKVGDTITLSVGERKSNENTLGQHVPYSGENETFVPSENKTYNIVGIYQRPAFEEYTAPGYTLITKGNPDENTETLKNVFVKLKNPYTVHKYVSSKANNESYVFHDNVLRFMGLSSDDKVITMLFYGGCIIVVAIIMIGSVFLIYNSFNISLNERTHQFGILSSIGATGKQLRNSVLFEGLCIGGIGIPIGIIVGLLSIYIVISLVDNNFRNVLYSNAHLTLVISVPAIIGAALVSLITILISAYIPARKAANTPVIESIRQTNEVKIQPKDIKTSKIVQSIFGLEGTLALKNFKRNKKRYRSIVLSLVLSVVLFVSTNTFVSDMQESVEQANVFTTFDIGLDLQNMDDSEMINLYDKLKDVNNVYESSYQAVMPYVCTCKASDISDYYFKYSGTEKGEADETIDIPLEIQFIDNDNYKKILKDLNLNSDEYMNSSSNQNVKMIAVAKLPRDITGKHKEELHDMINMFNSSSMNFDISPVIDGNSNKNLKKNVNFNFVEVVPPDTATVSANADLKLSGCFKVLAPYSLKEKFEVRENNAEVKGLTFSSRNPSASLDEMKTILKDSGIKSAYTLFNFHEMLDKNRNLNFVVNLFAYIFVIMISLIAVANVFNTISTNIKIRKRELAMLRSIGMSDHDFQKMMNFECIFYGLKSLIIGLPLSAASSYIIYKLLTQGEETISYSIPWISMCVSTICVFFIVFITMLYSISKIKKENIIDALRDDME